MDVPREPNNRVRPDFPALLPFAAQLTFLVFVIKKIAIPIIQICVLNLGYVAKPILETKHFSNFLVKPIVVRQSDKLSRLFDVALLLTILMIIAHPVISTIRPVVQKIVQIAHFTITNSIHALRPKPKQFADRLRGQILQDVKRPPDPKRPEINTDLILPNLANIVAEYAAPWEFGADSWERVGGVRVDPLPMSARLLTWLDEDDEIDLQEKELKPDFVVRKNRETFYPPMLKPKCIRPVDLNPNIPEAHRHRFDMPPQSVDFSIEVLEKIAQNPSKGYFPTLVSHVYQEIKNKTAKKACWILARKEIVGRNLSEGEQIAKFGPLPTALAIATVARILHLENPQNRYLVDQAPNLADRFYWGLRVRTSDKYTPNFSAHPLPIVIGKQPEDNQSSGKRALAALFTGIKKDISNTLLVQWDTRSRDNQIGVAIIREFE